MPKTEENRAYRFMGKHGLTPYPYDYMLQYKRKSVQIQYDTVLNLPFILHNNKRLFFPTGYSEEKLTKIYLDLLIEQDINSAHRYVKDYSELAGKTLLDVGSAEGLFSLDTIEYVDRVFLFECESQWIAPLKATFAPWNEKVTIVKSYVSDHSGRNIITIDGFLKDKRIENLFIKMDIEGAERPALAGAMTTLQKGKNIDLVICTYHSKNDPEIISNFVSNLGYTFAFTPGLIYWNKGFSKGVIRCNNRNKI